MNVKEIDDSLVYVKEEDIQKAWSIMSMHNSELLLENAELRKQVSDLNDKLWKQRFNNTFRGKIKFWFWLVKRKFS
jgi:hypothetical protein